ncbi:hypothetical protein NFI96_017159 [Prochilodus magdalenae]|nr:hypothetical protein NFI96_017159 [Prochilodus magdalenae]
MFSDFSSPFNNIHPNAPEGQAGVHRVGPSPHHLDLGLPHKASTICEDTGLPVATCRSSLMTLLSSASSVMEMTGNRQVSQRDTHTMEYDLITAMNHLEEKIQLLGSNRAEIETAWAEVKVELVESTEEKKRIGAAHDLRLHEIEGVLVLLEKEKEEREQDRVEMERLRQEEKKEHEKMKQMKNAEIKNLILLMEKQREEDQRESRTTIDALRTKVEELQVDLNQKNRVYDAMMNRKKVEESIERMRQLEKEQWLAMFLRLKEDLRKKEEEMRQVREENLTELDRVRAERSVDSAEYIQKLEEENRQLKEQLVMKEEQLCQERTTWEEYIETAQSQIQRLNAQLRSVKQEPKEKKDRERASGERHPGKFWRRTWRRLCILPDLDKVKAVTDFKTQSSVKQVRQFLGLTSYYRRFIQDYARHAEPLFALTKQDSAFVWDEKCDAAMHFLKSCLTSAPILRFPDFSRQFSIHTDASDAGLGAALMQKDEEGRDVAVAYASRTLHKAEKPYSTPEKECLAVIWALEYFRPYVEGLHVTIFTDHSSLRWLMSRPNPSGRLLFEDAITDILPDFAIIGSLDLRALPPVMPTDKEHLRELQLEDPVTGKLLRNMENRICDEDGECESHKRSPFISDFFKHVVSTLGTEHRLTTADHPQTNATVRVNGR